MCYTVSYSIPTELHDRNIWPFGGQRYFKIQDGGCRHIRFCRECIFDVRNVLYIKVLTVAFESWGLLRLNIHLDFVESFLNIVTRQKQFFEFQDGGSRHQLKFWSLLHFRRHRHAMNWSRNISTKFCDECSVLENQNGGAAFSNVGRSFICDVIDVFITDVVTFPSNLVMIGQTIKTWQQFVES